MAQRHREYLNNHLRQRQQQQQQQQVQQQQVHQQRAMMMRSPGISMPSGGAAPTPMPMGGTNPRLPQAGSQQFSYSASNYGTGLPSPPPHPGSSSPFSSPLSPNRLMASQGVMGNVGGQYGGVMSPPLQHSPFQFSGSGICGELGSSVCVCVCSVSYMDDVESSSNRITGGVAAGTDWSLAAC